MSLLVAAIIVLMLTSIICQQSGPPGPQGPKVPRDFLAYQEIQELQVNLVHQARRQGNPDYPETQDLQRPRPRRRIRCSRGKGKHRGNRESRLSWKWRRDLHQVGE